jgi:hypothetical protein
VSLVVAVAIVVLISGVIGLLIARMLRRRAPAEVPLPTTRAGQLMALVELERAGIRHQPLVEAISMPLTERTMREAFEAMRVLDLRNGDRPPGKGPGPADTKRCPHPACGSPLVPLTITPVGIRDWRCIGCHTEYVDDQMVDLGTYKTMDEAIAVALADVGEGGEVHIHTRECKITNGDSATCTCEPQVITRGPTAHA